MPVHAATHAATHAGIRGAHVAQVTPQLVSDQLDQVLHPDELALALAMTPARRTSFVAGRSALREALRRANAPAAGHPILRTPRGAPLLPVGLVGSVSHKRSLAVAVVAPQRWHGGEVSTVGIDVEERPVAGERRRDIASRILTAGELRRVPGGDTSERHDAVLLFFALKEAIYKAIDPYVLRYIRFTEVELQPEGSPLDDQGDVSVRFTLPEFAHEAPLVRASWWRDSRHIFAVASSVAAPSVEANGRMSTA